MASTWDDLQQLAVPPMSSRPACLQEVAPPTPLLVDRLADYLRSYLDQRLGVYDLQGVQEGFVLG